MTEAGARALVEQAFDPAAIDVRCYGNVLATAAFFYGLGCDDLRCAPNIGSASYDCIVLTQTLHLIDDMRAVVSECARLLRPGGVLLVTMPCASRIANDYGPAHDHWRVTAEGARRLFGEFFGPDLRCPARYPDGGSCRLAASVP